MKVVYFLFLSLCSSSMEILSSDQIFDPIFAFKSQELNGQNISNIQQNMNAIKKQIDTLKKKITEIDYKAPNKPDIKVMILDNNDVTFEYDTAPRASAQHQMKTIIENYHLLTGMQPITAKNIENIIHIIQTTQELIQNLHDQLNE